MDKNFGKGKVVCDMCHTVHFGEIPCKYQFDEVKIANSPQQREQRIWARGFILGLIFTAGVLLFLFWVDTSN